MTFLFVALLGLKEILKSWKKYFAEFVNKSLAYEEI